jgi:hypothetical protein
METMAKPSRTTRWSATGGPRERPRGQNGHADSRIRQQCARLDSGMFLRKQFARKNWDARQQLIVTDGLIFALTTGKELALTEANQIS